MEENLKLGMAIEILDKASKPLKKISDGIDKLLQGFTSFDAKVKRSMSSLDTLGRALKNQAGETKNLSKSTDVVTESVKKLGDRSKKVGTEVSGSFKKMSKEAFTWKKYLKEGKEAFEALMGRLDKSKEKSKEAMRELRRLVLLGFSYLGISNFGSEIKKVVESLKELEKVSSRITNITGSAKFGASALARARNESARLNVPPEEVFSAWETAATKLFIRLESLNLKAIQEFALSFGGSIGEALSEIEGAVTSSALPTNFARMGITQEEFHKTLSENFGLQARMLALQDLLMSKATGRVERHASTLEGMMNRFKQTFKNHLKFRALRLSF